MFSFVSIFLAVIILFLVLLIYRLIRYIEKQQMIIMSKEEFTKQDNNFSSKTRESNFDLKSEIKKLNSKDERKVFFSN